MAASGLEKSDLGKNRFYSALNMPYPNRKLLELRVYERLLVIVVGQSRCSYH